MTTQPHETSLADDQPTTTGGNPFVAPAAPAAPVSPAKVSIVDTILDLDAFLSGDVRLAEKTARFCTEPQLEADIDDLSAELDLLTDAQGNPLQPAEGSLADGARTAVQVALELQAKQAEYGAAFRSVRMRQLPSEKWNEWRTKHKTVFDKGAPYGDAFWDDLIAVSALRPAMTITQVQQLRARLGDPQIDKLGRTAWDVNTNAGVSVPKSPLSSHVLRQAARAQS